MSESNDDPGFDKEGLKNVLMVAIGVCLVCSVIVSTAAVVLKPMRLANQELDQKQNILRAAGLLPADALVDADGRSVDELFAEFEVRAVDLETGEFVDSVDTDTYDPIKAAKDPSQSMALTSQQDIATIGRREDVSLIYLEAHRRGAGQGGHPGSRLRTLGHAARLSGARRGPRDHCRPRLLFSQGNTRARRRGGQPQLEGALAGCERLRRGG